MFQEKMLKVVGDGAAVEGLESLGCHTCVEVL